VERLSGEDKDAVHAMHVTLNPICLNLNLNLILPLMLMGARSDE